MASLFFLAVRFPETLRPQDTKDLDIAACNPLRFLSLFRRGGSMAATAGTIALQSFGDYPNLLDFNFVYLKSVLGYGQREVGNFATAVGVTQILGGEATKKLIEFAGQSRATLLCNASWVAF